MEHLGINICTCHFNKNPDSVNIIVPEVRNPCQPQTATVQEFTYTLRQDV